MKTNLSTTSLTVTPLTSRTTWQGWNKIDNQTHKRLYQLTEEIRKLLFVNYFISSSASLMFIT
jgi:hypothetical protein